MPVDNTEILKTEFKKVATNLLVAGATIFEMVLMIREVAPKAKEIRQQAKTAAAQAKANAKADAEKSPANRPGGRNA